MSARRTFDLVNVLVFCLLVFATSGHLRWFAFGGLVGAFVVQQMGLRRPSPGERER